MRRISLELGLVALVLGGHLYAMLAPANSLVMNWFHSDDAFYYFQTARNIVEGHGVTFDGLGRDSGFHPLWLALITPLFPLARIDSVLPLRLVIGLSALFSAGTAVLIYRLVRRALGSPTGPAAAIRMAEAALVALFFAFTPYIHNDVVEMGMESSVSAFCIALLLYRVTGEECAGEPGGDRVSRAAALRMLVTGLVAALTVLARLDNIFLVGIAGAWLVFRPVRLRYLLVSDTALILLGVLGSYMLRVGFGPQFAQSAASAIWMCAAALAVRLAVYYFLGLYQIPAPGWVGLARQLVRCVLAALLSSALLAALMLALFALRVFPAFPRLVLVYEAGFALAAVLLTRLLASLVATRLFRPAGVDQAQPEALRWQPTLTRAACYFAPVGLFLAVYMGWSLWYFGAPMPVSGQVKRWWGTLPNVIYGRPVTSLGGLLGFFPKGGPWGLVRSLAAWPSALPEALRLLVYGGLAAALLAIQRRRAGQVVHAMALYPLFIGSFIQLISYTGTGYIHTRPWYWVSHELAITLLAAILLDAVLSAQTRVRVWPGPFAALFRRIQPASALLTALCLLVAAHGIYSMVRQIPGWVRPERVNFYLDSTRELEANTEPGARIGCTGGGVVAYFVRERTIVNLDGLMNTNEYFQMLQQGKASQYLDRIGLRYIYTSEYPITSSDPYFQFKGRLEKISAFGGSTLFRWK